MNTPECSADPCHFIPLQGYFIPRFSASYSFHACGKAVNYHLFSLFQNALYFPTEGWLSGRKHRTANAAEGHTSQGFESLTFRQKEKRRL